jgi:hypothetical protein
MTPAVLLTLFSLGQPDAAFRDGLDLRADAAAARPKFVEAAKGYDAAWQAGGRTAAAATNRARAHALAGDLPGAIAAVHAGLRLAPYDAELLGDLEILRDAVVYPQAVRPARPGGLRSRVSPWDVLVFAALASVLGGVGLARQFTTRDGWAVPAAAVGGFGLLVAAAAGWQLAREERREAAKPVLVVVRDTTPRKGNGDTYPGLTEWRLPRGGEVRELHRRGGWVQAELANGVVGWLPESVVIQP